MPDLHDLSGKTAFVTGGTAVLVYLALWMLLPA